MLHKQKCTKNDNMNKKKNYCIVCGKKLTGVGQKRYCYKCKPRHHVNTILNDDEYKWLKEYRNKKGYTSDHQVVHEIVVDFLYNLGGE